MAFIWYKPPVYIGPNRKGERSLIIKKYPQKQVEKPAMTKRLPIIEAAAAPEAPKPKVIMVDQATLIAPEPTGIVHKCRHCKHKSAQQLANGDIACHRCGFYSVFVANDEHTCKECGGHTHSSSKVCHRCKKKTRQNSAVSESTTGNGGSKKSGRSTDGKKDGSSSTRTSSSNKSSSDRSKTTSDSTRASSGVGSKTDSSSSVSSIGWTSDDDAVLIMLKEKTTMDWEEIAYALRDKGINRRELRQKYHDLHKNGKNEKKKTDKAADETAGAIHEVPISRQMPSNGPNFVLGRSADKPTLRYARGEYEGIDDEKIHYAYNALRAYENAKWVSLASRMRDQYNMVVPEAYLYKTFGHLHFPGQASSWASAVTPLDI